MARLAVGADEKNKLMFLGVLFVLIMAVIVVLYRPGSKKAATPTPAPTTPAGPAAAGAPPDLGGPPGGAGAPATGASTSAPGGITAASLVSVENYRPDPFAN